MTLRIFAMLLLTLTTVSACTSHDDVDAPPEASENARPNQDRSGEEANDERLAVVSDLVRYLPREFESFAVAHFAEDSPLLRFVDMEDDDRTLVPPGVALLPQIGREAFDDAILAAGPSSMVIASSEFRMRDVGLGDRIGADVVRFRRKTDDILTAARSIDGVEDVEIPGFEAKAILRLKIDSESSRSKSEDDLRDDRYLVFLDDHTLGLYTRKESLSVLVGGQDLTVEMVRAWSSSVQDDVDLSSDLLIVRVYDENSSDDVYSPVNEVENFSPSTRAFPIVGFVFDMPKAEERKFRLFARTAEPRKALIYFGELAGGEYDGESSSIEATGVGEIWERTSTVTDEDSLTIEGRYHGDAHPGFAQLSVMMLHGFNLFI